jgi:hypothetical protein
MRISNIISVHNTTNTMERFVGIFYGQTLRWKFQSLQPEAYNFSYIIELNYCGYSSINVLLMMDETIRMQSQAS